MPSPKHLRLGTVIGTLLFCVSIFGSPADYFAVFLAGRVGRAHEVRSPGAKDPSGPNPKFSGIPLDCTVVITGATGRMKGDVAEMSVSYEGVCWPAGLEGASRIWGKFSFLVTLHACQPATLVWGDIAESGGATAAKPDLKIPVRQALQDAIAPAF